MCQFRCKDCIEFRPNLSCRKYKMTDTEILDDKGWTIGFVCANWRMNPNKMCGGK